MLKTTTAKLFFSLRAGTRKVVFAVLAAIMLAAGVTTIPRLVRAESISQQIEALRAENTANKAAVADLAQAATSYQNAIAQMEAQISQLQAQINDNESRRADLEKQIADAQAELVKQRAILSQNIKAMYVDSSMSTIEQLATSKDLSEFVDKETYRNAVQHQIQNTLDKIAKLQAQLNSQKQEVEDLLKKQQAQRDQVAAARAEQANLLAMNQQQQEDFNARTRGNQAKIDALIEAQRRANLSVGGGGYYFIRVPGAVNQINGYNYPYAGAGFSMQLGPCSFSDSYPDSPDDWGYCTRQCVSYAAWAVEASGRPAPRNYGNARDWVSNAPSSYVFRYPEAGDVAISTSGQWGHAMYVEAVDGNRMLVSQYNAGLSGEYSKVWKNWR